MRQVWKCDFCFSGFFDTPGEAEDHERACIFNPSIKGCHSCGNCGYNEHGMQLCAAQGGHSQVHNCPDVENCECWVPEK